VAGQLAAEGLPTFLVLTVRDFDALPGPVWSAVLVLEGPAGAGLRLRPALARGQVLGRERTSEIARRERALAATNGGFFALNGDPLGCLMIDGELISEPVRGRTCVGILRDGQILFAVLDFDGALSTATTSTVVHGVNRERGPDELIVYRRAYGPSTRTNGLGAEAVVLGDVVQQIVGGQGNTPIPPDGYILSGHGRAGAWIREQLKVGDRITLRLRLVPAYGPSTRTNGLGAEAVVLGDVVQQIVGAQGNTPIPPDGYILSGHGRAGVWIREQLKVGDRITLRLRLVPVSGDPRWQEIVHVIGGGPRLLADGRYVGGEGFTTGFLNRRHPRTVIARLADGRLILVVVDGRQPYHSLGMTLVELAAMLRTLGATDAVNLDGGGSSTLVVRGTVVNLPSDEGGERPVSDALLVVR